MCHVCVCVNRNMTLKALAAFKWILKYCSHATYFLKADDDAFVNEFAAIKHLRDIASAGYRRRLLMCLAWHRPVVARRGKWAVSRTEFARRRYPSYCCGLGYVVTGDVVALLLSAAAACHPHVGDNVHGSPQNDDNDVRATGNLPVYDDAINCDDIPDADKGHYGDDVTRNPAAHDVTAGRRFWIDDVYVTGLLVEALGSNTPICRRPTANQTRWPPSTVT